MQIPNILQRDNPLSKAETETGNIFTNCKLRKLVQHFALCEWVSLNGNLNTGNPLTLPLLSPLQKGNIHTGRQK